MPQRVTIASPISHEILAYQCPVVCSERLLHLAILRQHNPWPLLILFLLFHHLPSRNSRASGLDLACEMREHGSLEQGKNQSLLLAIERVLHVW